MTENEVRIVQLEALHVASTLGFGEGPEGLAAEKILGFARTQGLLDQKPTPRFFGFNNPSPSAGSSNYGYEIWMEVGPAVSGNDEIILKDFPGGTYAVLRCHGVQNIVSAWKKLSTWVENSEYHLGNHQWLEQHVAWIDLPIEEYILDLYAPVRQ